MAFGGSMCLGVNVDGIIGASFETRLAADALVFVEFDNSIGALVHGCGGADANARRVFALIAAGHLKVAPSIRELPLFNIFYPGAENAERHLIFFLARDTAGVTPD